MHHILRSHEGKHKSLVPVPNASLREEGVEMERPAFVAAWADITCYVVNRILVIRRSVDDDP